MKSIGKSYWVSFCVRVVCATWQARRSGMGACGASAPNVGGPVAKMSAGPGEPGARLLRRHKGFKLFWSKVNYMQGFYAVGLFWLRRCKGLRECNCKTLNTSSGARVLRLFDSKSC